MGRDGFTGLLLEEERPPVKDGLRLETKIISRISLMDENIGGGMVKPLIGKLGGGRGQETGGHRQSEERVVWESRLGRKGVNHK